MKLFVMFVAMMLAGCASLLPNDAIRVSGSGKTEQEALNAAYKKAVEYKLGTIILGSRESTNLELVRNEVATYSAGYVEDYKIVSTENVNSTYNLVVDVWVKSSKIADRVLSESSPAKVGSNSLQAQANTYINQVNAAESVLQQVMNDYPKYAFNVIQDDVKLTVNSNRIPTLKIHYKVSWSNQYLGSLTEALSLTEESKGSGSPNKVYIISEAAKYIPFPIKKEYLYYDYGIFNRLVSTYMMTPTYLKMDIVMGGKTIVSKCIVGKSYRMYHSNFTQMSINTTGYYMRGVAEVPFPQKSPAFESLAKGGEVKLSMTRASGCKDVSKVPMIPGDILDLQ